MGTTNKKIVPFSIFSHMGWCPIRIAWHGHRCMIITSWNSPSVHLFRHTCSTLWPLCNYNTTHVFLEKTITVLGKQIPRQFIKLISLESSFNLTHTSCIQALEMFLSVSIEVQLLAGVSTRKNSAVMAVTLYDTCTNGFICFVILRYS